MAIKRDVYEICPLCGQKDAELRDYQVAWGIHKCPHAPPGPSTPPMLSSVDSVNFIPHAYDIPRFLRSSSD